LPPCKYRRFASLICAISSRSFCDALFDGLLHDDRLAERAFCRSFLFVVHDCHCGVRATRRQIRCPTEIAHFSEDGTLRECAPPNTFSAMRQFDDGPATGIPTVPGDHLSQFSRHSAEAPQTCSPLSQNLFSVLRIRCAPSQSQSVPLAVLLAYAAGLQPRIRAGDGACDCLCRRQQLGFLGDTPSGAEKTQEQG
jgi:hypothetical protein